MIRNHTRAFSFEGLIFVLGILAGYCSVAIAQPPSNPERDSALLHWRTQLVSAYAMQAGNVTGFGERIRMISSRFAGLDSHLEAIQALDQLLSASESPFDTSEAWRMKGQYLWARGDLNGAGISFSNQLAVYDAHPVLKSEGYATYASGVNQFAAILHLTGFTAQALQVCDRIINDQTTPFPARTRQSAFLNRIALLTSSSQCAEISSTIETFLNQYPKYGAATGEAVTLRLKKISCDVGTLSGPQRVELVRELFDDPEIESFQQRFSVGEFLIEQALAVGNYPLVYETAFRLLDLIDAHGATWLETKHPEVQRLTATDLAHMEKGVLALMESGENHGSPSASLVACERLIQFVTDPERRTEALLRCEQLRARISQP
ncbi:MAG: hypothetical protein K2W85_17475 [Phycisphaerales bacterium]|nr:hypothetical protein [Phycisphaerales bacterium]